MERLFDLDFQLLHDSVLTLIAVLVLVVVATNLLFNPVREFLKKRQEKIRDEIDQADQNKADAEKLKADYEGRLKEINKEAEEILNEARKKAVQNQNKIVDEAKEEAVRIIAHAKSEAELEKQKAADEMKQQMITIASMMAGKVISSGINTEIQDTLVEDTLKEMGDGTWLS